MRFALETCDWHRNERCSYAAAMPKPPPNPISIRPATHADVPLIRALIAELAEYERLAHEMTATESLLEQWLFGSKPAAEVVVGEIADKPEGFALFFHNFSTFL